MIGLIQLAVFGFLALSVVYVLVSIYSRSVHREQLEKEWDEDPPDGAGEAERAAYVEAGLAEYEHGLRHKLIWLVYIIPLVVVAVLIYLVNYA